MNVIKVPNVNNADFLIQIDGLLTPEECRALIKKADEITTDSSGNKSWHISSNAGNYERVIMIDRALSTELFRRIIHLLPTEYLGCKVLYMNDVFRFSRYNNGGEFAIHKDGTNFDRNRTDEYPIWLQPMSMFTLNIFLNDNFRGGETDFYNSANVSDLRFSVKPKVGRAGLFYAKQWHTGNKVIFDESKGETYKYLLRTDIMVAEKKDLDLLNHNS
jgi:prolyl 4-hydroxylase